MSRRVVDVARSPTADTVTCVVVEGMAVVPLAVGLTALILRGRVVTVCPGFVTRRLADADDYADAQAAEACLAREDVGGVPSNA